MIGLFDLFVPNFFAHTRPTPHRNAVEPGLRCYRDDPQAGVIIQINTRTHRQGRVTSCALQRDQARLLAELLLEYAGADHEGPR